MYGHSERYVPVATGLWQVNYIMTANGDCFRVSRGFETREGAQEFIDVNAMVWPLPGCKLIDPNGNEVK